MSVRQNYTDGEILHAGDMNSYGIAINTNEQNIANKEDSSNKIADMTTNDETKYPSIPAVRGYINDKIKITENTTSGNVYDVTYINDLIANVLAQAKLDAHPIGSYYWSSEDTDPGELFGGTWEPVKDRFILAAGDKFKKDYRPEYIGSSTTGETGIYPTFCSSFQIGNKIVNGGEMGYLDDNNRYRRAIIWDWSNETNKLVYNDKEYSELTLVWNRKDTDFSNIISLYGRLVDNTPEDKTDDNFDNLVPNTNLYIHMSDESIYTITPYMLSNGSFNPTTIIDINNTGGSDEHIISNNEMPGHDHTGFLESKMDHLVTKFTIGDLGGTGSGNSGIPHNNSDWGNPKYGTANWVGIAMEGGSQAHNNMPPYEIAYCWRRIPDSVETNSI